MRKIDLGKIVQNATNSTSTLIHPRDVFNGLPAKAPGYGHLRGAQDQVLDQWYARRATKDLVIKINTGGGKTIVGLLIALSCLNEKAGPVAYLVPDHYLAEQVREEADRLGIEVTEDPRAFAYSSGRGVLVDVFQRIFNGQSVFGISGGSGRRPVVTAPGTVIVDDAHACLTKAEQAFRLTIPSGEAAFSGLLDLFEDSLSQQSPAALLDLKTGRSNAVQQVPYWAWADRQSDVLAHLHPLTDQAPYLFSWPLLADVLPICRAVFTSDAVEIAAPCLPVAAVTGFRKAQRRVYLTATLADDGVLVTDFDANPASIAEPIVPASAGDIGDRLILVPQQTHPTVSDDEIRELIVDLAKEQNVVVIVPSVHRADYWRPYAALVLDKDNLRDGVDRLRDQPDVGLAVLINRYDGVDLPDDACHVLVIDGLPEALDGLERLDHAQLSGSDLLVARQVQRLEQGMGRATRSNEDHCVVILLGTRLAERLHGTAALRCFSPATRAQLELSGAVAAELQDSPLDDLVQVIDQCLRRNKGWTTASRTALATVRYEPVTVAPSTTAARAAFDHASNDEYREAVTALQPAANDVTDPVFKGYLQQQMAAYMHHVDPAGAQQLQRAANKINRNLLRPIQGVHYDKLHAPSREQAAAAASWLQEQYESATALSLGMQALLADLEWGQERTKAFEAAWSNLAWHLGFAGQRPEQEIGRGPDGLWALVGGRFLVCEAKTGAKPTHPVYKEAAEQLSNAMDWFRNEYPGFKATPVLIHPRSDFDNKAAVPTGCRVITTAKLKALRTALTRLQIGLADTDCFRDPVRIGSLLESQRLTARAFTEQYSLPGRRKF